MRKLLLLLALTSRLAAQGFTEIQDWRVHDGDNPAWARPDFDDSGWTPSPGPQTRNRVRVNMTNQEEQGWHWYRASVPIPARWAGSELALGMPPFGEAWEVYADGVLVGNFGRLDSNPAGPLIRHKAFRIPAQLTAGPVLHLAVRRWVGATSTSWLCFATGLSRHQHAWLIGLAELIEDHERLHTAQGFVEDSPWLLTDWLLLVGCVCAFTLYSLDRRQTDYLIIAIYCLCAGAPPLLGILLRAGESVTLRSVTAFLLVAVFHSAVGLATLIVARLCVQFRSILTGVAILLLADGLILAASMPLQWRGAALVAFAAVNWLHPAAALAAVWESLRKRAWFAAATAASLGSGMFLQLISIQTGMQIVFFEGPLTLDARSIEPLAFVGATLVLFYSRSRAERLRQARVEEDMAAARRVQEMLLQAEGFSAPGFRTEAIYRPAREVGGDFYQFLPGDDGSLLVVVGDVSGKGLDAAMLVAVVVGAVGDLGSREPASVLAHLNRALSDKTRGGFVTCCCALFRADGIVEIANAGHLAPYIGGDEIGLVPGVPLGLLPDAEYEAATVVAGAGEMTFFSDGVPEATNGQGELLGFERLAGLSVRPAVEIAREAERWGQEDDITVVQVAYA
jgi:sigma-B regulation protein RsbU (phosphoserine phosphatase)